MCVMLAQISVAILPSADLDLFLMLNCFVTHSFYLHVQISTFSGYLLCMIPFFTCKFQIMESERDMDNPIRWHNACNV